MRRVDLRSRRATVAGPACGQDGGRAKLSDVRDLMSHHDLATALLHIARIGGGDACVVDDASVRRPDGHDSGGVRLDLAQALRPDHLDSHDAVGGPPPIQLFEPRELALIEGDDELAAQLKRNRVLFTEGYQATMSLDAGPCLERSGRVVDAAVQDAAV